MKQYTIPLLLFLVIMTLVGSCICGDLERDNPLDPNSPSYVETKILSGLADGMVLTTDTLTVIMDTPDNFKRFHYQLDGGAEQVVASGTIVLPNLDEGQHTISIWMENDKGKEDATPVTVTFSVDAIAGPALLLKPKYVRLAAGQTVRVQVMLEELEPTDSLTGLCLSLSCDPARVKINSVTKETMLAPAGADAFDQQTVTDSTVWLLYKNVGDENVSTGSGALVTLEVEGVAAGLTVLNIDSDSTWILTTDKNGQNPDEDKIIKCYDGVVRVQ